SAMTPLVSALISFITFIASIMHTTVSSVTVLPISTNGAPSGDPARRNVPPVGEMISFRGLLSIGFGAAGVVSELPVSALDGIITAGGTAAAAGAVGPF